MAIGIDGTINDAGQASEIAALGLEVCPDIVLTAEAVNPPTAPPRGRVRQLFGDEDWAALGMLRNAWQGPPSDSAAETFRALRLAEARALAETGAAAWFGVTAGDGLVSALGIVSDGNGIARYQDVETHPEHRRRGHARQLLHAAATYAERDLMAKTLVIVADPAYHAIELYRSVGFHDAEWQIKLQPATPGED
jgi:ribosomal protein S18 acetylase RimI-like enzyme